MAASAPCAETDTECLLKQTLQLSYELEAERLRNQHLENANKALHTALEEEEKRADSGGKIFILGGITFLAFFGGFITLYKGLK